LEAEKKLAAAEESAASQIKLAQDTCAAAVKTAEEARTVAESEMKRIAEAMTQKEDQLHDARQRFG
jgi:hypothetical protein